MSSQTTLNVDAPVKDDVDLEKACEELAAFKERFFDPKETCRCLWDMCMFVFRIPYATATEKADGMICPQEFLKDKLEELVKAWIHEEPPADLSNEEQIAWLDAHSKIVQCALEWGGQYKVDATAFIRHDIAVLAISEAEDASNSIWKMKLDRGFTPKDIAS